MDIAGRVFVDQLFANLSADLSFGKFEKWVTISVIQPEFIDMNRFWNESEIFLALRVGLTAGVK